MQNSSKVYLGGGFVFLSQPKLWPVAIPASLLSIESSNDMPEHSREENELLSLFDELRVPLHRYLLSLHLSPSEAEEIVQETFLRLFLHLRDRKPRENLRGWIFRVGRNLALKERRNTRRQVNPDDPTYQLYLVDPSPNPELQATLNQRQTKLLNAIADLPDQDQECLHLRAEGLRYREIGEVLNLKVTTVWDSLNRSMKALRRSVSE